MAIRDTTQLPQPTPTTLPLPSDLLPDFPGGVRQRFPELTRWEVDFRERWRKVVRSIQVDKDEVAFPLNHAITGLETLNQAFIQYKVQTDTSLAAITIQLEASVTDVTALAIRTTSLEVSVDTPVTGLLARVATVEAAYVDADGALAIASSAISAALTGPSGSIYAAIETESTARANADSALATRTDTLEAQVQTAGTGLLARVSTIEAAYVDEAGATAAANTAIIAALTGPSGSIFAAVEVESFARATADGFLEGQYTLQVIAGDIVTGMNITSASGGGGSVSQVIFQANKFQIYNGTSGTPVFDLVGSDISLNANVTVHGRLDVGTAIERTVIDGTTFRRGQPTGNRSEVYADSSDGYTTFRSYNSANELVALMGTELAGGHGQLRLHTAGGVETVTLDGDTGRMQFSETARGSLASAAVPTYSFTARTGDGLYSSAAAEVAFALGGLSSYVFNRNVNDYSLDIGASRAASGSVAISLIGDTSFPNYGLRIERGGAGPNAQSQLLHRGTGSFQIVCQEAGAWIQLFAELTILSGDLHLTGARFVHNDGVQILATRGAAVSAAPTEAATDASESHSLSGSDTMDQFGVESALDELGAKYNDLATKYNTMATAYNTLLDRLKAGTGHGLIAS